MLLLRMLVVLMVMSVVPMVVRGVRRLQWRLEEVEVVLGGGSSPDRETNTDIVQSHDVFMLEILQHLDFA